MLTVRRINLTLYKLDKILDGDIQEIMRIHVSRRIRQRLQKCRKEAVDHHRMICDALRRLDRAALVSSITTHVRYVEEQIIRNIRENEQST